VKDREFILNNKKKSIMLLKVKMNRQKILIYGLLNLDAR
jgi:hypothetical protein